MLPFEGSTQARSWLFSEQSLERCRKRAIGTSPTQSESLPPVVRKFASGFHQRWQKSADNSNTQDDRVCPLGVNDQETLVRFHAHQIQALVGPAAILPELRRSASVLATATLLFRRFYLSNSVVDISPRKMAVASAFFASKLEEERVELAPLSHATALVQQKVRADVFCRKELAAVSEMDIEDHENMLMEGLNFQFICHHPHASVGFLVKDVINFIQEEKHPSLDVEPKKCSTSKGGRDCWAEENANELLQRALQIVDRANIFTDVPFLFAPGHFACAVVAIAFNSVDDSASYLGEMMQDYLVTRYPLQSEEELTAYSRSVSHIMFLLLNNDSMDLRPMGNPFRIASERSEELQRVLRLVSKLRAQIEAKQDVVLQEQQQQQARKRKRTSSDFTPPRSASNRKMARVTPTYY